MSPIKLPGTWNDNGDDDGDDDDLGGVGTVPSIKNEGLRLLLMVNFVAGLAGFGGYESNEETWNKIGEKNKRTRRKFVQFFFFLSAPRKVGDSIFTFLGTQLAFN